MTALVVVLLLLSGDAGTPDAGVPTPRRTRSAEDEEIIRNLALLEQLADSEALEMVFELDAERPRPDHP